MSKEGIVRYDPNKITVTYVREISTSDVQTILAKSISKDDSDMEIYWYDVVEDGVRELAKLGTIRVVEG